MELKHLSHSVCTGCIWGHSDPDTERWGVTGNEQSLSDHLDGVVTRAIGFLPDRFHDLVRLLGYVHDAGKVSGVFQANRLHNPAYRAYYDASRTHVDHKGLGVRLLCESAGDGIDFDRNALAYCVAGHHGGLPDAEGLESLLQDADASSDAVDFGVYRDVLSVVGVSWDDISSDEKVSGVDILRDVSSESVGCGAPWQMRLYMQFVLRWLFSALVDADFLDTESCMSHDRHLARGLVRRNAICDIWSRFDDVARRRAHAASASDINAIRSRIYDDCVEAGVSSCPGIYVLDVPTGSGKTRASMGFALAHANAHDLRRVVVAIPFTSIVEQTAADYVEGDDPLILPCDVVQHHSNREYELDVDFDGRQFSTERLTAENWDAPIIVTTHVQLLESMFANKPSKCRKLHNLHRSVIIMDELQSLPVGEVLASSAVLEFLVREMECTVLLCTATQPSLDGMLPLSTPISRLDIGRDGFGEVFGRRSSVENVGRISSSDLVRRVSDENEAMVVVDTKRKAYELCRMFEKAGVGDVLYLTTNLVPCHRLEVIREVKRRLASGERCVLVATQLVDAGVDVSFPLVWRERAGLPSVVQTQGRCNRAGEFAVGRLFVFAFEDDCTPWSYTAPYLQREWECTRDLLPESEAICDFGDGVSIYYERYYEGIRSYLSSVRDEGFVLSAKEDVKSRGGTFGSIVEVPGGYSASNQIVPFADFSFSKWAEEYRLVDSATVDVFVPDVDGRSRALLRACRDRASRGRAYLDSGMRQYCVSLRHDAFSKLGDYVRSVDDRYGGRVWYLAEDSGTYSKKFGICIESAGQMLYNDVEINEGLVF